MKVTKEEALAYVRGLEEENTRKTATMGAQIDANKRKQKEKEKSYAEN